MLTSVLTGAVCQVVHLQVRGVDFTFREQPEDITRRLLRLVQIDETQVNTTAALPTHTLHTHCAHALGCLHWTVRTQYVTAAPHPVSRCCHLPHSPCCCATAVRP